MAEFKEIATNADSAILERLGEAGVLDGVDVRGVLSTPVTDPRFHVAHVGLQEYEYRLSNAQAVSAEMGSILIVGDQEFEVSNIIPGGDGFTSLILNTV